MAREFFSTLPDSGFMRMLRRGGRNEILFTVLGLGFLHFTVWKGATRRLYCKDLKSMSDYKKVLVVKV